MAGPIARLLVVLGIDAREMEGGLNKAKGSFMGFNASAKNVGMVVGAAVGGMGIAALKMGDEYKKATDSIRLGTGATGKDLEGLERSFQNVAGTVKEDIGTTAQVLADLNTRTGLTGEALEGMTKNVIEFSRVTGSDAVSNVASLTRVFGDWSIATEDQEGAMDKLFRASQSTGIEIGQLQGSIVSFGAPLRQLGFSFEESAALLGKFEKEGVNTELVLGGMKKALGTMAKAGEEPIETFKRLTAQIENAGSESEAGALAVQLFGTRAGPDMKAAIREGRFAIGDYVDAIENGSDTVRQAADDTRSFGDGFAELKNKVKLAVGPIMSEFAGLTEELGNAIYLLPALTGAMGRALGGMLGKMAAFHIPFAAAGTTLGSVTGAAFGVAFKAAAIVGAGGMLAAVQDIVHQSLNDALGLNHLTAAQAGQFVIQMQTFAEAGGNAFDDAFRDKIAGAIQAEMTRSGVTWEQAWATIQARGTLDGAAAGDASGRALIDGVNAWFPQVRQAFVAGGLGAGGSWAEGIEAGTPRVVGAVSHMAEVAFNAAQSGQHRYSRLGGEIAESLSEGVKSGRDAVSNAMIALKHAILEPIDPVKERTFLEGKLASKKLAEGLASENPYIRNQAEIAQQTIRNELAKLPDEAFKTGKKGGEQFSQGLAGQAGGMNSHVSEVIANANLNTASGAAARVRSTAAQTLSNTAGFRGYGSSTASEYVGGISSQADAASRAANAVVARVRSAFRAMSPPENPLLRPIRSWGENLIGEWLAGIGGMAGDAKSTAGNIAGSFMSGLSPALSGGTFAGPTSGTQTLHLTFDPIHVTVNGNVSPEAGREIGRGIGEGMDLSGVARQMRSHQLDPVMPR